MEEHNIRRCHREGDGNNCGFEKGGGVVLYENHGEGGENMKLLAKR